MTSAEHADRVGQSETLGSYVEYRERWTAALWPLIPWLMAVAYLLYQAWNASPYQQCGVSKGGNAPYCLSSTAAANREGAAAMAIIISVFAAMYVARRVLRWPWVRVGELGIEDRTQLFGIVRVGWQDVLAIPASSRRPITHSVDVRVSSRSGLGGPRAWVRIRTGGLTARSGAVEAEMDREYRAFHRLSPQSYQRRLASNRQILDGIEVQTERDNWDKVTRADLHHLIERNDLNDYLVVISTAGGQDHFIQARHTNRDVWDVEYRDGGPGRHFAANCMTNTEVYDAFMAWILRDPQLRRLLAWHPLEIETSYLRPARRVIPTAGRSEESNSRRSGRPDPDCSRRPRRPSAG
jgi:hypothetical protein